MQGGRSLLHLATDEGAAFVPSEYAQRGANNIDVPGRLLLRSVAAEVLTKVMHLRDSNLTVHLCSSRLGTSSFI